ncbi:DUF2834 domain-containing protein [Leptolyngbyaceae cyanobacterium UHCC 1019]
MLQNIYLLLCLLGFVLPYSQFIPFLTEHSLNLQLFFEQLFANRISAFFAMDLLISSIVFWVFLYWEGSRLKMTNLWVYVVCNLAVGLSLGFPLFLLMRQRKLEQVADQKFSMES